MSSAARDHADTIRRALPLIYDGEGDCTCETHRAYAAVDALVTENEQLRDSLAFYRERDERRLASAQSFGARAES